MVSNEVVMQTIRRMISTGVDDETIRMTLRGINLADEEIDSLLRDAKGISEEDEAQAKKAVGEQEPEDETEPGEDAEGENAPEESDEGISEEELNDKIESASQEQYAHHAATHNMLEGHGEKMEEMSKNISELHEKMDSAPQLSPETVAKLSVLDARISSLEKEILETKANTIALQDLLKKILETDRKTLFELQKKK